MAGDPVNISEFQELARQALPKMYYDFFSGGAEDEHTLRENVEAFQRITFQPRILIDVNNVDVSSSILGYNVSAPIMVAPTGMHKLAHPEGEVATARAAAALIGTVDLVSYKGHQYWSERNVAVTLKTSYHPHSVGEPCNHQMVLSFSSNCTIQEVASSCNAIRFYQLYVYQRRDVSEKLVQRAEQNGFKAIVLTADAPKLGRRERDKRNRTMLPMLKNLEGLLSVEVNSEGGSKFEASGSRKNDPSLSWKDIGWLKSITSLPILIKGVLTAEDARMAVDAGVAGVVVSNHGGRQLDYAPASITVLEEVVEAVAGRVPVLIDGGIRRGTDVFKALALGAQAVMVGRPVIYSLAAKGEYGVRRVIEMLRDELELTMALNGCRFVEDITRSHVRTERDRLRSLL